jgi:hypothetical protein
MSIGLTKCPSRCPSRILMMTENGSYRHNLFFYNYVLRKACGSSYLDISLIISKLTGGLKRGT